MVYEITNCDYIITLLVHVYIDDEESDGGCGSWKKRRRCGEKEGEDVGEGGGCGGRRCRDCPVRWWTEVIKHTLGMRRRKGS